MTKRVLITGAASGIGLEMARTFQAAGYRVHVCDASSESVSSLKARESGISASVADVGNPDDMQSVFQNIDQQLGAGATCSTLGPPLTYAP
ncbi:MAG: SDR family NAD(P)-dependent oxidoreductase, partial [Pseudomonadota bacterium]